MTYTDLLARLEAATEGSRELDAEIHVRAVFGRGLSMQDDDVEVCVRSFLENAGDCNRCGADNQASLRYTTSLDAALTLLPAPQKNGLRCRFWLERKPTSEGTTELWFAECCHHADKGEMVSAPTAALAACKAILRARQFLEEQK